MTAQQRMDDILNECIDRLARGETVEACLARYPEHAPELRPLLLVARATLTATAQITPRAEFRMAARHRFLDALAARHAREREAFLSGPWLRRWGAVTAGVALLVVIGSGTVAAAETSLPLEPLYTVKQATEAFQVALAPEGSAKAKVYAQLAARRLEEISTLARQGDVQSVDQLTSQFEGHLDNATLAVTRTSPERAATLESAPRPAATPASSAAPATAPVTATPSVSPVQAAQPAASPTPSAAPAAAPAPATPTASVPPAQAVRPAASPTPQAAPVMRPAAPAATPTPVARPTPATGPAIRQPAATPTVPAGAKEKAPVKAVKPGVRPSAQNLRDVHDVVKRSAEQQIAVLEKALQEAPAPAKPTLERALEKANKKYSQAIRSLEKLEQREQDREDGRGR